MNDAAPSSTSRIVRRYQRGTLNILLLRRLGREDEEDRATEILDLIWLKHLSETEKEQLNTWTAGLPETLRNVGPDVKDDWDRASGKAECSVCGLEYYDHPTDPREKFPLHVGCDGRRWKL